MAKVPQELYDELVAIKIERGYASMSELFRDALRIFVSLHRPRLREGAERVGGYV